MGNVPPGRILVVDDTDGSRLARAKWLRDAGHTVFEASTLRQCEVLLRECRPELIVLDVHLPDGSGLDFCRQMKKDDEFRMVMVLQMSASFITEEDHIRGLEAGADAYLIDPTSPGVLVATTNALLRLNRAESALQGLLAREREARADAEAANRVKDDFLATLSHELRTPLNAIVGWTTLMRTIEMDEDARRRAIEIIERNAKSQAALIEDLLDVSRIAEGQLQIGRHPVHMPMVVAAAIDTIRPSAEAKGLRLDTDIASDQTMTVEGDAVRLQQVVWNLLTNSIKFTPSGGWVNIRLALEGRDVELRIADNGRGISPEFMPHVFDRFRQASVGPTHVGGGLGLGLAIARQLVEMHGGTLTAHSEGENRGATFIVRLPVSAVSADQSHRDGRPAAKENQTR